jgi:hypothetical protein
MNLGTLLHLADSNLSELSRFLQRYTSTGYNVCSEMRVLCTWDYESGGTGQCVYTVFFINVHQNFFEVIGV